MDVYILGMTRDGNYGPKPRRPLLLPSAMRPVPSRLPTRAGSIVDLPRRTKSLVVRSHRFETLAIIWLEVVMIPGRVPNKGVDLSLRLD